MTGDFTRSTFRAANHFSQVRAQQGRAVLDAELNEQADITAHVARTTTVDAIGANGAPFHPPGTFRNFQIRVDAAGTDLLIAPGRIYVGGIQCENDTDGVSYSTQPDLSGAPLPSEPGSYAVYLDVWEQHVSANEQPAGAFPQIREAALGGADTASRVRVVWQVRLASVASSTCGAFVPPAAPTGKLRASEVVGAPAGNDCLVPTSGGYRRLENQLYRVEVHAADDMTVKWSRDNASMSSKVTGSDQGAATIVVEDAGRDDVSGFAAARYVELTDEVIRQEGRSGVLLEVDAVTGTSIRVRNPDNLSLTLGPHPILRRWDGVVALPASTPTELEDGVQVERDNGGFEVGDYWLIPARTLTGKVEWPRNGTGETVFEPRHGTRHHYAELAVVSFTGTGFAPDVADCRSMFPPLTAITARDVIYDPAACSNLQGAATVQEAIDTLCRTSGGEEPGIHIKRVALASGAELLNDELVSPNDVLKGIRIECDERLFEGSVLNRRGLPNPICTVTVQMPWPLPGPERDFWAVDRSAIVGFQPIVLAAEVVAQENAIVWTPLPPTQKWLAGRLMQMYREMVNEQAPRVLVRLKLAGRFIWGPDREPRLYLDGEGFGVSVADRVDVRFPSGDGRRGGDFDLWFWLADQARPSSGIGFVLSRASQYFSLAAGGTPFGVQALQLGLDRSAPELRAALPEGYVLDAGQRFNQAEAATLSRRTGVQRITGLVSQRFERVGAFIAQRLPGVLNVQMALEVISDVDLPVRVRNAMASGAPPDFIIGDEALLARLQHLDYGTTFVRI